MYARQPGSGNIRAKAGQVVDHHFDESKPGKPLFLLIPGAAIALVAFIIALVVAYRTWLDESIDSSTGLTYLLVLGGIYVVGAFIFSYGYELYNIPKALRDTVLSVIAAVAAVVIIAILFAVAAALGGGKGGSKSGSSSSSKSGSSGRSSSGSGSFLSGTGSGAAPSGSASSGGSGGGWGAATNIAVDALRVGQIVAGPVIPPPMPLAGDSAVSPQGSPLVDPNLVTCPNCGRMYYPSQTNFVCPACGVSSPAGSVPSGTQAPVQPGGANHDAQSGNMKL